MKPYRLVFRTLSRTRPSLLLLAVFTLLLGLINWLIVNQNVVLYLFYIPVIFAALKFSRREAVGIASLAALLVVAYALFLPQHLVTPVDTIMLWIQLVVWGGILIVTAYMVVTLKCRIQEALGNLQRAYRGVLAILTRFIQRVDADTEAHCARVSAWSVRLGRELQLGDSTVEEARIAGLLHDVGKVDVSVELLRKAATLSQEEQEEIREHAALGAAIVKPIGGMLASIADAIETHHEKYDGTGYRGLRAEQIPLLARIVAAADAFDAMLSDRPYRKGMPIHEALDSVAGSAGSHFDPMVVAALHRIVNREGDQPSTESLTKSLRAGYAASAGSSAPDE